MTLPLWPAALPDPLRAAYLSQRQDIRLRRAANGPPSFRRRYSSNAELVTLGIEVTRTGKALFDQFYDLDTRQGTLPFKMPDPATDGRPLLTEGGLPLLTETGAPILVSASWLCVFGEPVPSERIVGGRFEITFNVAVMP
ncbi:hypothetical protein BOO69_09705 [Sulfitobacter alexandrii]|uniref:Uncharacterized protein n=1 Tax=Sulfitobacter alexandrii TaxID=1917485 RepID=A0A1J0WH75_9RHOB|nr:hypothetical protein [Sulfitobacter alexandrii]APE43659.1 hypothetical protein BOO69_09705 [Sulfitobacter alexandrii]